MSYRQMVTNDDGEPLGFETIYVDEPEPYDPFGDDDPGYYEDHEDESGDFDTSDQYGIESDLYDAYDDDPSPYNGTYSEE